MDTVSLSQSFYRISGELCNLLYVKELNKTRINSLIDELNSKPYKAEIFVRKHDAVTLVTALCLNIRPEEEFLSAKTSHLVKNIVTKQNLQLDKDYLAKVVIWHIQCLMKCSDIVLPDLLHNVQCIIQTSPGTGQMFTKELIGSQGILTNLIDIDKSRMLNTSNTLQILLISLKCIICLVSSEDSKSEQPIVPLEIKEHISQIVIKFLMRGYKKTQDEFLFCKAIISAIRILTQLYFNDQSININLPEVMGICRFFVLYGLVVQDTKPEKLMPSSQTIAAAPVTNNARGGKKQRIRKHRNNAIESLKKDIPVSDHSLMKDVDNFENNSAYKPISVNFLEPKSQETKSNVWTLTSDSDMSDVESGREARLVALKSRVRQSASNLFLVLIKVREKREIFGYWWALLPDSPDVNNWFAEDNAKKTLAYCAVTDPIASSRANVLSVILALLSGSRMYLSQAEISKKETASFTPFSVSLGYVITCLHKVLAGILESERSQPVVIVALKCCAALVQATPYHKMEEGLISELVRPIRKFLVHREVTLQVGALITMGCVVSVDPKVNEVLKAIEKDTVSSKSSNIKQNIDSSNPEDDDCCDFEEGYSDDEMFTTVEDLTIQECNTNKTATDVQYFKSWILDICFKNMGWAFRGDQITRCNLSLIPVILESLQVLSAVAYHHLSELLLPHLTLLADVLSEMLQHEHQDVVLQAARTISVVGDGLQKLDQTDSPPSLTSCVYLWEKLLTPLSVVLQGSENAPAKAVVCDCIANIGERCFKELPRRLQLLCCVMLVGSCRDEEATVRAAAVRALAMAVMYKTLRQDVGFVSDCGENVLRALSEPSLVVRAKVAWALGNLSDALVLNMEDPEADDIDDDLLLRLLEVSIQCAADNDKVKMNATRALGNLLRLIKDDNVRRKPQIRTLCDTAIEKLLECACKVTNMKVRWNACYAIGNAMRNENLFTCFNGWQGKVFPSLCTLAQDCKNLKVRINAATALRAPTTREQYGDLFLTTWRCVMAAMENAANVDDFTEYKHKDNLVEQLCVTLAHLCCLLKPSDLPDIYDPLVFYMDTCKESFSSVCRKLPPEHSSCLKILRAAKHVTVDLTADQPNTQQAVSMLQHVFVWDL